MSAGRRAPAHLRPATAAWWRGVARDFELGAHHERLLTLAAEAFDRCAEAREAIAEHGAYFTDRFGQPRAHPALAIERDSRIAFARLLRELGLDDGAGRERTSDDENPFSRFAALDGETAGSGRR